MPQPMLNELPRAICGLNSHCWSRPNRKWPP